MRRTALLIIAAGALAFAQATLRDAVLANQVDKAQALLKSGANPNEVDRYGVTPLWVAAMNGSSAMTKLLLASGANAKATMPHGETALMAAARTGEPETIQLLIAAGADLNARESGQGETALMWAAAENHGDAIRLLMKGGANPNQHGRDLDLAPMNWLNVGMVSTVLPRGGWTALMYAARQDAVDAARALAESGANLEEQDPDGSTALQIAITNQHYDLAAMLLEKGASPNTVDATGMSAIFALVDMNLFRSEIGRPARSLPDKNSALDVLKLALSKGGNPNLQQRKAPLARHHGFPDNTMGEGATALMRAIKANDLDAAQILLDGGANPALAMKNGNTALLMLVGTRPGPGPAADKMLAGIKLLAEHGADVNAANPKGETPLQIATRLKSDAVVQLLTELGAKAPLQN